MNPTVSVVTTVFNGEPFADRAIPSILAQTYRDFEFILVDDGSTDGTIEILRQIATQDNRVRVFTPGRQGRVKALNYAVQQARGIFIANQDFDDISYPQRLRLQAEFLNTHPHVGVVGSYYLLEGIDRNERYERRPPIGHTDLVREFSRRIPICHTLAMFRKQAWEDAGGYPVVSNAEDLALWINMVKCGWEVANIPLILGKHFEHRDSFFHKSVAQWLRHREMMLLHLKAIHALKLPLWMLIYPFGRSFYLYLPDPLKRVLRRACGGSHEVDIS